MATSADGAIAQLGERLLCKQEVVGSIPSGSTNTRAYLLNAQAQLSLPHRARRFVALALLDRRLANRAKFASSVFELAIFYIVKRGSTWGFL